MACIRLPAAVDGTADEALEAARDELRLRSGGLHATPVRALLGVIPVGSPAADASGVRALAVDGGRVLLYGGYRDQANRCLLFDLDEPTMANPRPGRLALPGGPPLRPASSSAAAPRCTPPAGTASTCGRSADTDDHRWMAAWTPPSPDDPAQLGWGARTARG
jgi:hypothetical protein